MGFFDFFKSKPEKPAPSGGGGPRVPTENDGPTFEYLFAHVALRQIGLANPLQFLGVIASPDQQDFLNSVIQDVAETGGQAASFDAASVKAHPTRVNGFPCAVLELPPPDEMAEAYMVALVVFLDSDAEEPPDFESIKARYFTLEKGFTMTNEPRTVLCEWTSDSHLNFGDGPEPTVEAFVEALQKIANP